MTEPKNLAVVAGNGLSVAFTDELLLGRITERLVEDFDNLVVDGSESLQTLRKLADRIEDDGAIDEGDFEQLVGSFESQAALLNDLSELAKILPDESESLLESIQEVQKFTRDVLSRGTGIVLKAIFKASDGYSEHAQEILELFRAMDDHFDGKVTFANLNYDILVLKSLLELRLSMCDMGAGYGRASLVIRNENGEELGRYSGKPLRKSLDFPAQAKFRLVHPHGSLTYWKRQSDGLVAKVEVEAIRSHDLFSNLEESTGNLMPAVVLANSREKPKRVREYPFSLAYDAMRNGLDAADHWLIVGYSFRDESVNDALRLALSKKKNKPKILISTYGNALTKESIEEAIGSNPATLIDRDGVKGLQSRWLWDLFVS